MYYDDDEKEQCSNHVCVNVGFRRNATHRIASPCYVIFNCLTV